MPSMPRRRGASGALLASALAFAFALPALAPASPLGEATFYDEGIRPEADILYTTAGPDGNVWFVDGTSLSSAVSGLGKITPAGAITEYLCGEGLSGCNENGGFTGITAATEGTDLWFTDRSSPSSIGRIDSASPESVEEFSIEAEGGNAGSSPLGIVADSAGRLWFTDDAGASSKSPNPAIGVFDPSAPEGERVEEFSAGIGTGSHPRGIVVGSDGALWFTDIGTWPASIGRIDPNTHVIEKFPFAYGGTPGGTPFSDTKSSIVSGPDGDIWFTEPEASNPRICKIEVAEPHEIECLSDGLVTPKNERGSKPIGLTAGAGKLWFTDNSSHDEEQAFGFGSSGSHWTEGHTFELCNEDESSCATGTYKKNPGENSAQVLNALESIYGTGNVVIRSSNEIKVTVRFVSELARTDLGQTSCRRPSGGSPGCFSLTVIDGGPDAIGSVNEYDEISRYPIDGLDGVNSISYAGGSVWFPATSDGAKSIGRLGIEATEQPLTAKISKGEGTIASSPAGLVCAGPEGESCEAGFEENAEVTLTASAADGYRFFSWNCANGSGTAVGHRCTVTMDEAKEVRALFIKTWDVTVAKAAGSEPGVIKTLPTGVACPFACASASFSFVDGEYARLVGYEPSKRLHFGGFVGGTGPAEACDGETAPCLFKVEGGDSTIEALFEENEQATLSIEKEGGGMAGISGGLYCPNTCSEAAADFYTEPEPEEVTLSWKLKGVTSSIEWTSGAGTCTGKSEAAEGSCEVTMDEAHELVAKLE